MEKNFINSGIKNANIDKGNAIIAYNKYKGFTLPVLVLVVSVLVFIFIVIPGVNQFIASQKQLDEETQKLEILKNNFNFLTNLKEQEEGVILKVLARVLPIEKDFFGIMTGVSAAAGVSNVRIDNYKFLLGNLSKATEGTVTTQYPTITMKIVLNCSGTDLNAFINNLYKTAPLVEVSVIKFSDNKATLDLNFYFKPFPPQNISDSSPISKFSKKDNDLIEDIKSWNNILDQEQNFTSGFSFESTSSGIFNFDSSSSGEFEDSPFQ